MSLDAAPAAQPPCGSAPACWHPPACAAGAGADDKPAPRRSSRRAAQRAADEIAQLATCELGIGRRGRPPVEGLSHNRAYMAVKHYRQRQKSMLDDLETQLATRLEELRLLTARNEFLSARERVLLALVDRSKDARAALRREREAHNGPNSAPAGGLDATGARDDAGMVVAAGGEPEGLQGLGVFEAPGGPEAMDACGALGGTGSLGLDELVLLDFFEDARAAAAAAASASLATSGGGGGSGGGRSSSMGSLESPSAGDLAALGCASGGPGAAAGAGAGQPLPPPPPFPPRAPSLAEYVSAFRAYTDHIRRHRLGPGGAAARPPAPLPPGDPWGGMAARLVDAAMGLSVEETWELHMVDLETGGRRCREPDACARVARQLRLCPEEQRRVLAAWLEFEDTVGRINAERREIQSRLADNQARRSAAALAAGGGGGAAAGAGSAEEVDDSEDLAQALQANMAREDQEWAILTWSLTHLVGEHQTAHICALSYPFMPSISQVFAAYVTTVLGHKSRL